MNTPHDLFTEFSSTTKTDWIERATADLKGADFSKKLCWKTDEGFTVDPFYTVADRPDIQLPCRNGGNQWRNYTEINVDTDLAASRTANYLKQYGAEGFLFRLKQPEKHNIEMLLQGLDPMTDEISFTMDHPSVIFLSEYLVHLNKRYIRAERLNGFYECDVLEQWSLTGARPLFGAMADILVRSKPYPGFRCLVIRSHSFVNAGSNISQELAFTLHKISDNIDALRSEGLKMSEIMDELVVHLSTGSDYFMEIAKLRAIRILLSEILGFYGFSSYHVPIISSTANWQRTALDANTNILRNTSAAMSAVLGGCDALLIQPHDSLAAEQSNFSQRIALNIGNILRGEAYFDKVHDPAAGSYYIDHLTDQIVESTLKLFREIEARGGYMSAFKNGIIQQMIAAQRNRKIDEIATRKRVFVGVNKYANKQHTEVSETIDTANADVTGLLPQLHATWQFEKLRERTRTHAVNRGETPSVYLAAFGNVAMRKARASFAEDFFALAAFDLTGEHYAEDVSQLAVDAASSNADIVVLCAADEDYAAHAITFINSFRQFNQDALLVLAGYPTELVDALAAGGINYFIHIRSNAIDTLSEIQDALLNQKTML